MTREDTERNVLTWGRENQQLLENTSVGIVGVTQASQLLTVCLLSLGIGEVILIDNVRTEEKGRDFLVPPMDSGESYVKSFADSLAPLFPHTNITGIHSPPLEAMMYQELPDILIDLSGNAAHSAHMAALANRYKRPSYFGVADATEIILARSPNPYGAPGEGESSLSCILAAICADEVRRNAFSMQKDETLLTGALRLSLHGLYVLKEDEDGEHWVKRRICEQITQKEESESNEVRRNILVAGAGALGNFTALCLAFDSKHSVDIYDEDFIEGHNLNRQFLFRGHEGEPKASTLSRLLGEIASDSIITGHDKMIDAHVLATLPKKYDLIISCVDSIKTRMLFSEYAVKHQIPLLNGGTSSLSGIMQTYIPKKTACLSCQGNLEGLVKLDGEEGGCSLTASSSIMPNAAIGGLIAYYAEQILRSTHKPCTVRYSSLSSSGISFECSQASCTHTK